MATVVVQPGADYQIVTLPDGSLLITQLEPLSTGDVIEWDDEFAEATNPSATVTGTAITDGVLESEIVTGSETIIITLTDDTWVASGATFDAQRQNIIAGVTSAQSESTGWNAEVRDNLAVTTVVRTSDTICTTTLSAQSAYEISTNETVTITIPATALTTSTTAIVGTPTIIVTNETVSSFQPAWAANATIIVGG